MCLLVKMDANNERMTLYELDLKDRKILYELDLDGRQPLSELAKKVKASREVVKYRIKQLQEKGILKNFVTILNPARFGHVVYKIYIQFENLNPNTENEVIEYLMKNRKVFWIAKCEGAWDLIFAIYANHAVDASDFLSEFVTRFNTYILTKSIANEVRVGIFRRCYLLPDKVSEGVIWGGEPKKEEIDETDLKIMALLAENCRMPTTEIAEKIGSDPRTVARRIKDLIERKYILGFRIVIDRSKLNYLYFKSIIYLRSPTKEKEQSLLEFYRQHPNILYYIKCLGTWELEIEAEVEDYSQYNKIIRELRSNFGDIIKTVDTVLITEELKGELNITTSL